MYRRSCLPDGIHQPGTIKKIGRTAAEKRLWKIFVKPDLRSMIRKILITGGAGFIASPLAAKLGENSKNHIVIVDDLSTGSIDKIPTSKHDNTRFIKADVNVFEDISNIFFSFQPDYVFHYAAVV